MPARILANENIVAVQSGHFLNVYNSSDLKLLFMLLGEKMSLASIERVKQNNYVLNQVYYQDKMASNKRDTLSRIISIQSGNKTKFIDQKNLFVSKIDSNSSPFTITKVGQFAFHWINGQKKIETQKICGADQIYDSKTDNCRTCTLSKDIDLEGDNLDNMFDCSELVPGFSNVVVIVLGIAIPLVLGAAIFVVYFKCADNKSQEEKQDIKIEEKPIVENGVSSKKLVLNLK